MSGEKKKECKKCGHEEPVHNAEREPYGLVCSSCIDEKNMDPCRQFRE